MNLPTYNVRFKDEAAWIAVLGSIGTITGMVLIRQGVDAELTAAIVSAVSTVGRLIIGALLPSPEA